MEDKKIKILNKLLASFDNTPDGFSARKLSAFAGVMVAIVATFKYVDEKVIISALIVWLVFGLMCLGIITAEQLLKFYKDDSAEIKASNTTTTVVEENRDVNVNVKT